MRLELSHRAHVLYVSKIYVETVFLQLIVIGNYQSSKIYGIHDISLIKNIIIIIRVSDFYVLFETSQ